MKCSFLLFISLFFSSLAFGADRSGNNFLFETRDDALARVELKITAVDLKSPLSYSLKAKKGAVASWIYVPGGTDQVIEITLFGANGKALARGKSIGSLSTVPGATLLIPALKVKTGKYVGASLSAHRVVIKQIDEKPGKDGKLRFQAQLFDERGQEVPIKPGTVRWADFDRPGFEPSFDPRRPGIGFLHPRPGKLKLNPCLCILGQACLCVRPPQPIRYLAVTAGSRHACAINESNQAFCWGDNTFQQLGVATNAVALCAISDFPYPYSVPCSTTPVSVSGTTRFISISAGERHTCAIDMSGNAWCWGSNQHGQLGIGGSLAPAAGGATPQQVAGTVKYQSISAGQFHTCALGTDGIVHCWGRSNCGQAGPLPGTTSPVAMSTTAFKALSAGAEHNCAIASNGNVMCWGRGDTGQIGFNGNINPPACGRSSTSPGVATFQPAVRAPAFISAGGYSSCVGSATAYSSVDGAITCWGADFGSPSSGTAQHFMDYVKQLSIGGDNATADYACALSSSGNAYCWGANYDGRLGVGSTHPKVARPSLVVQPPERYVHLDSGVHHRCAIDRLGEVFCWGDNHYGQLGDGSQTSRTAPVRVFLRYLPPVELGELQP